MKKFFPSLALIVLVLASTLTPGVASASAGPEQPAAGSAEAALANQLALDPSGEVEGNRITYPDGRVFVAVDAGTFSLPDCGSGQFCVWPSTNYSGSFTAKTGQGVTRALAVDTGSFYNNRAKGARLYSNDSTSSACYGPGTSQASVSAAYDHPAKVYLSATTTC